MKKRCDYRVTFAGALYVVIFLLVGAAAINSQRAMLFIMFGLMMSAFFFSVIVSRRMVLSVDVTRSMPQRSFANRVVHLSYLLRHLRRSGPAIGLEVTEHKAPAQLESVGAYCLFLGAAGSFQSGSRFVVHHRGKYTLSSMRLSTCFPFSLVRAVREFPVEDSLMVWPALGRLKADILLRGASEVSDSAPSQVGSGADEFFGLREYRQGDNPRWIHWKRTAATNTPVIKEMSRPRPDVLYIVLDTQLAVTASENDALREKMIRFAATLAEHAVHREYRVGLSAASSGRVMAIPAGAGIGHRVAVMDALAGIDANRTISLAQAIAATPKRMLHYAQVVVIALDPAHLANLDALRKACQNLIVICPAQLEGMYEDDMMASSLLESAQAASGGNGGHG